MELAQLKEKLQTYTGSTPLGNAALGNALAFEGAPSGIAALDQSLVLGGLPTGRVTEIAGGHSSGKTTLGLRFLVEQTNVGNLVAVVDGSGQFYPPAAAAMGLDLQCTLLVTPSTVRRHTAATADPVVALARAAEIIVRSRAFSMVLVDLPDEACLHSTSARRLRVAAQATGTTIIVLCSNTGNVEGAAARIHSEHQTFQKRAQPKSSAQSSWNRETCRDSQERNLFDRTESRARSCQASERSEHGPLQRVTNVRVSKGGQTMLTEVEHTCPSHRFDSNPPQQVAPVIHRPRPGTQLSLLGVAQ